MQTRRMGVSTITTVTVIEMHRTKVVAAITEAASRTAVTHRLAMPSIHASDTIVTAIGTLAARALTTVLRMTGTSGKETEVTTEEGTIGAGDPVVTETETETEIETEIETETGTEEVIGISRA